MDKFVSLRGDHWIKEGNKAVSYIPIGIEYFEDFL